MKPHVCRALLSLFSTGVYAADPLDFHDHLGLQLWSLRAEAKTSVSAALDRVVNFHVSEVETAGTGALTVAQFSVQLRMRGLNAVSAHISYEALKGNLAGAIKDAQTLGVKYLVCPSLPRDPKGFSEVDARRVAVDFNIFGAACKAAGLRFGYHPHGFEFTSTGAGNGEVVFDVLVRETKPELVCFEMDVFWIVHAGQDPITLLKKYPNRWLLMHVKDMRKGAVTGLSTGSAPPNDHVAVGAGQINWPGILRTAQAVGVQHYFIEDETPTPLQCLPDSLRYLRDLKL